MQQADETLSLPVLNEEHLARTTFFDPGLEQDLLRLFRTEATSVVPKLAAALVADEWTLVTHTLKGASRTIGAERLARAAERAEAASFDDNVARETSLAEIEAEIAPVLVEIDSLLAAGPA